MTRSAFAPTRLAPSIRLQQVGTARRLERHRCRSTAEPGDKGKAVVGNVTSERAKEEALQGAVEILHRTVVAKKFDSNVICAAFQEFQTNKMKFEDLNDAIGGGPDGKFWELQFVASIMCSIDGIKGAKDKESDGYRFPLTAVQHFDNGRITNGVFLGHVASVRFIGTYETKNSSMQFVFEKIQIQIGPGRFTFPVGSGSAAEGRFVFFYADEDFVVARGLSGGTAFWKRIAPSDLFQMGAA